jgi:tRNA A37 threonylcarbamoyladenosine modification protein TsaB
MEMTKKIKFLIVCTLMAMTINTAYPPGINTRSGHDLNREFIFSTEYTNGKRIDTDRLLTYNTFILLLGALLVSFSLKSKGSISLKEGDS